MDLVDLLRVLSYELDAIYVRESRDSEILTDVTCECSDDFKYRKVFMVHFEHSYRDGNVCIIELKKGEKNMS